MKHIVLIPTFNEEESIAYVLSGIQKTGIIDEIVVCDNGSTDTTVAIACSHSVTVTHEKLRGYGHTLMRGVDYLNKKYSSHDDVIITFMDGDGVDDPSELVYHKNMCDSHDMIFGSRTVMSKVCVTQCVHAWVNVLFGALIFLLYGQWYTDLGPFRSMYLSTFLSLNIQDRTYGFTAEPQCTAAKNHLKIHEYKTNHRPRYGGVSKVSGSPLLKQIRIGIYIIRTIVKNRF